MKIYTIPGIPKIVCEHCGARARPGETRDGLCWKCQRPVKK